MVIKLSDYILEQSISDASVSDIEIERLFAEMNVCMCLLNLSTKQTMFQEALTTAQPPANTTQVIQSMNKPTTAIVGDQIPGKTNSKKSFMSNMSMNEFDMYLAAALYTLYKVIVMIVKIIQSLISKSKRVSTADKVVISRWNSFACRYVEYFTVVMEPMLHRNPKPYLNNLTLDKFQNDLLQFANKAKKEYAISNSSYDEFRSSGGMSDMSRIRFDEQGGPLKMKNTFRLYAADIKDVKFIIEENISRDIDIRAMKDTITVINDLTGLSKQIIRDGENLSKSVKKDMIKKPSEEVKTNGYKTE